MESYPKVSIIILNWNGLEDTIECLESLKKISYLNYEVIACYNGSKMIAIDKMKKQAQMTGIPGESSF